MVFHIMLGVLLSRAPHTIVGYVGQLKKWAAFAKSYKFQVFPARPMDLSLVLLSLMDDISCYIQYVLCFKWVHNIVCNNPETDPTENNLVKSLLEAAKRRLSKPVSHKVVLPSDILVKLCVKYHDLVDIIELRDLALFILLFSGFLIFSKAQNLLCSDVKILSAHLELKIRSSKTDLFRAGDVVPIARTETVSCPVSVVSGILLHPI